MKLNAILWAVVAGLALLPVQASAFGLGGGLSSVKRHLEPRFLTTRGSVLAPMGHVVFCSKRPEQCRSTGPAVVSADTAKLQELAEVNRGVNGQIRPVNDQSRGPGQWTDTWSLAPARGDCEDFAITKRATLIARGWPSRALRLAVAKTASGEGHAVLIVRTSAGDMVLDNRSNRVLPWHQAGLTWLKIQSASNARLWQSL